LAEIVLNHDISFIIA